MMVDSQKEATAAALTHLGYDVKPMVRVYSLTDDSPATGILQKDDIILAANGQAITETDELRSIINAGSGAPVTLTVERAGGTLNETVTPKQVPCPPYSLALTGKAGSFAASTAWHSKHTPPDCSDSSIRLLHFKDDPKRSGSGG